MPVKELMNLEGRVALVTGGSRGLGHQIAEGLGEMGATVFIAARKQEGVDAAVLSLKDKGIEAYGVALDLSVADNAAPLVDAVMERLGRIDILVNNAGATWGAPAQDHPVEAWHKVLTINLTSIFLLTQEVGRRAMIPAGRGKIINIASVAGLGGGQLHARPTIGYRTTKGGLVNFTRALAVEWGQLGITVNAIAPGFFPSAMTEKTLETKGDVIVAANPMGKIGGPEDLKGLAVLLASDASAHINGQIIAVDGGVSAM